MMTLARKKQEFAVFCIESVAACMGVTGAEVYAELYRLGAIEPLLFDSYEALHTQSKERVVEEVMQVMREWKERQEKEGGAA